MLGNRDRQPETTVATNPETTVTANDSVEGSGLKIARSNPDEPRQSTASKLSFGKSRGAKPTATRTPNVEAPQPPVSPGASLNAPTPRPLNLMSQIVSAPSNGLSAREQAIAAMLGNSSVLKLTAPSPSNYEAAPQGVPAAGSVALMEPAPMFDANYARPTEGVVARANTAVMLSDEELARVEALLDGISADALAKNARQRSYLIYASTAVVLGGALTYVVGSSLQQVQMVRPAGWLLLFVPICVGLTLKETSKKLAHRDPLMAQRLCKWLAFGNPAALAHLSSMYADVGNYADAEKLLRTACKVVPAKNIGLHIVTHANLAAALARSGSIPAAERMLQESLDAARALKASRPVPSSSVVLATALQYAAEIKVQKGEYQLARELLTEAFQELAPVKDVPVEVLLSILSLLGKSCTIAGSDSESMLYLEKAKEISEKVDSLSYSQTAEAFAHLGWANYRTGNHEAGDIAFAEGLRLANTSSGVKALPAVHVATACMLKEQGRLDESAQAYNDAITACKNQKPQASHELVNIQSEYALLLRQMGKEGDAAAADLLAMQGRYALDQINAASEVTKKKQQVKPAAVQQQIKKKSRFPFFCLLIALFYGSCVVLEGVRVAPFHTWAWFIGFATVVAVKLRAKYGKQTVSDNHSALIAILSHLPFARYIVPELSTLPQRTVAAFLGCALVLVGIIKVALPAPDTVPNGLTSYEYFQLGSSQLVKESFNKSRQAFDRAAACNDLFGHIAREMIKGSLPATMQPDDAVQMNMNALKLKKHKEEAKKIWEDCIAKYPTFEVPMVHLAQIYLKDAGNKDSLKKADNLVSKAVELNPNNRDALMTLCKIKRSEGDKDGEKACLDKMTPIQRKVFENLGSKPGVVEKQAEDQSADDSASE